MRLFGQVSMLTLLILLVWAGPRACPRRSLKFTETDDQNTALPVYYLFDDRLCWL